MRRLLREPLVHFLLLGGLLFAWDARSGGSGPGSRRIAITPGLVQHLASGFERTWQRPPGEEELKALVDEHVKEEIATREALAMSLDRDDVIVRRRLRQKLEFLVEGGADEVPPTESDLQSWLDRHPEAFRAESRLALRQVYLSTERRGANARAEASRLLARLQAASPRSGTDALGDPSMLPAELPLGPLAEVSRAFGAEFAAKVEALDVGRWQGPLESPYGLHLVMVRERVAARRPALAEIRPLVEREVIAERRARELQAFYERLLQKYTVSVEMPGVATKAARAER